MWAALTRETWRARLRGVQRNVEVRLTLLAVDGVTRCQAYAPGQRRWAVQQGGRTLQAVCPCAAEAAVEPNGLLEGGAAGNN